MKIHEAIGVLNEENHLYTSEWRLGGEFDSDGGLLVFSEQGKLTEFEAKAIAEAYRKPEPGPATRAVVEAARHAMADERKHDADGRITVDLTPGEWIAFINEQEGS